MNTDDARELVSRLIYKPGWTFQLASYSVSSDHCYVQILWDAVDSDSFPGYTRSLSDAGRNVFDRTVHFRLGDDWTELTMMRRILEEVINLEAEMICHDAREFFRTTTTYDFPAPFHPHHFSDHEEDLGKRGRKNWADTHHVGLMDNESLPHYMMG